jgi:aryl-alcohol dehydrogenase-like predicted oxidoreductase
MIQDKVVIGTWPLSGDYGEVDLKTIQKTLECCYASNLKEFDTAPSYGNGFIEFCIGKVLSKKSDVLINTKIGNTPFYGKSFKVVNLKSSLEHSLKRLSVDSLNTLFIHNPRNDMEDLEGVLEFMNKLKQDGIIKHKGISLAKNYNYDFLLLKEFDVIQDDGNLLDMRFLDLELSNDHKFMARSPLANGILSGNINKNSVFHPDDYRSGWLKGKRLKSIMKRVDKINEVFDGELIDLAKKFVLSNEKINKVIFGVKNPEHVQSISKNIDMMMLDREVEIQLIQLYKDDFGLIDERHLTL